MNILQTIIEKKKLEVAERKSIMHIDFLKSLNKNFDGKGLSLKQTLLNGHPNIIAEFKRKSPSKGWISQHIHIGEVVPAYEEYGAAASSILTDEEFFGGNIEELKIARLEVDIPLLRKDFMIDEYQLYEAKAYGADVILLIAACLTKDEVKQFAAKAKTLNLEVLLEIKSEQEAEYICDEVDIIGINNRNLETFVTDIQTSKNLIKLLSTDKPVISESGISNVETINTLHTLGFKGFLIGENFMKAPKPAVAFAEFMKALKKQMKPAL
ncbi:indole-3-glycerol phosphate synthase TrpC [Parafilimonas sp.]|uniref:indole-3-glycerol phosphate synthase TrpC n=1 Tax=Parafilimonas sp. TaxID=1969739 RepID=UPI0039E4A6EA